MNTLRLKCKLLVVGIVLVLALACAIVVAADTYEHSVEITVTDNSSTDRDYLAVCVESIEGDNLIAAGFVNANATDVRLLESGYTRPFLVCDDKLIFMALNLTAGQTRSYDFYMGYDPVVSQFELILGSGGYVTVNDTATLEPGSIYSFRVIAYFDMAAGTNKTIIWKDGAINFGVTTVNTLRYTVTGVGYLEASSVNSGYHDIYIASDGITMAITVDDVLKDEQATGAVPNTANDWILFRNDVCPYVYYYDAWRVTT